MCVSGGLAFGDHPVLHGPGFGRIGFFSDFHEVDVPLPPEWVTAVLCFHCFSFFLSDLRALLSTDAQRKAMHGRTSRHPRTVLSGNVRRRRRDPMRDSSPPPVALSWRWLVTCAIAP